MGKKLSQKNAELLVAQQRTELEKLRESVPADLVRAAEDQLFKRCLATVQSCLDFDALGFSPDGQVDENSIPFGWLALSDEEKARKIRLARYACLPTADVPHGVKMAHATLMGIIKSRAVEQSGVKVLNLEVSHFPAPAPLKQPEGAIDAEFEVIDIE